MNKDWQRLKLYLDISDKGFFLIEAYEFDIVNSILTLVQQKKRALCVNFAEDGADYYNQTFDGSKYNCVVFYNLQEMIDAERVIDSFNMNRDNFAMNGIMYLFILPKYLANYLIVKAPNLHSYMTSHIELYRTYQVPFRPLLSSDNFVIDKQQIRKEKLARRDYKALKNAESFVDLFDEVEYYKYNRASVDTLISLLNSANSLYRNARHSTTDNADATSYRKFFIEFVKVAYFQNRLDISEYSSMIGLVSFQGAKSKMSLSRREYFNDAARNRLEVYSIVKYKFADGTVSYIHALQMLELSKYYASSLFYQKYYKEALDWFELINDTLNSYKEKGNASDDMICTNLCDIALCRYKLAGDQISNDMMLYFDKALDLRKSDNLSIKTQFVLDFNDLVYKIKGGTIRYEDYNISACGADYYKRICSEKSSIFASYLSLVAWIRGCVDGNIKEAVELNMSALAIKRSVLTENHYSIVESHYCNAVLFLMDGELERAKKCFYKALRILNGNSEINHMLIDVIKDFGKVLEKITKEAEIQNTEKS